jgi:hypothetical protein
MRKLIVLIAALTVSLVSTAAMAQSLPCDDRDKVLELLAKKYSETPVAAGVTSGGALLEVLTNSKSGTWSIIITSPQGMSCLTATGEGWRNMEQIPLGQKV